MIKLNPHWAGAAGLLILAALLFGGLPAQAASGGAEAAMERSRAAAGRGDAAAALSACREALALDAQRADYLRACAQLANWAGDYSAAADYLQPLQVLAPEQGVRRQRALSLGWAGRLDQAAAAFADYLQAYPQDADARLNYARVLGWRGDHAVALAQLEQLGDTPEVPAERARLLAAADRPSAALEGVEGLLEAAPEDFGLHYTRALALDRARRPRAMLAELDRLARLDGPEADYRRLDRVLRTPLRHSLSLGARHYDDADDIRIQQLSLEGGYQLAPGTRLLAGLLAARLEAPSGGPYAALDGDEQVAYRTAWLGARQVLAPGLEAEGRLGLVQGDADFTSFSLTLRARPADAWSLSLGLDRDLHAVSPRAVDEEVRRDDYHLALQWRPDLRYVVDLEAGHAEFSDQNRRWALALAPRRAVLRREHWNLDLGLSARWFGFDQNLNHGYYDPAAYRRYAATAFAYWKLGEGSGVSLAASAGWHKDDELTRYRFGTDLALEAVFGAYADWEWRLAASYADYLQETGRYYGLGANLRLTRRF